MKKLFLTMVLILMSSGCIIPGMNLKNEEPKVKEMSADLLTLENITVLPSSTIRPKDQFSIFFELTNQDEFVPIDVDYSIYDTGLCNITGGEPEISSTKITGSYDPYFSPKETRLVEWNFEAPSVEDIAYISATCPIRFKFNYKYNATSQIDMLVIDTEHLKELQRAGSPPSFRPTVNVGRGPIKIYFDFGATLPVKNDAIIPIYVMVEDKGVGLLREIKQDKFTISFPYEFTVPSEDSCTTYFKCDTNTKVCKNKLPIPIIDKKSLEIRCSNIRTPTPITIEKTFFINATVEYDYAAVGEIDIAIKP